MRLFIAWLLLVLVSCRTTPPAGGEPPREPAILGAGVISTDAEEWRITFTPDGRTAYFARSAEFFPVSRQATILTSSWNGLAWSAPTTASFSGQHPDIDPFITPDGQRLFFSSIRPVDGQPRKDIDLWMAARQRDGSWGPPAHLGPAVNSAQDELYPSVSSNGTLYFASDRPGGLGGFDIYKTSPGADGAYAAAVNVGAPINSNIWEFNPAITPDNGTLLFVGLNRPGGQGLGDIYQSRRSGGGWETPQALPPSVNTVNNEFHPSLSPNGQVLYFVRRIARPASGRPQGDLWSMRRR